MLQPGFELLEGISHPARAAKGALGGAVAALGQVKALVGDHQLALVGEEERGVVQVVQHPPGVVAQFVREGQGDGGRGGFGVVPVDGALLQVEIAPPGVGLVQSVHGHFSFQLKAWMMAAQAS